MIQIEKSDWFDLCLNIRLNKPINQYRQNQLNAMGKLITDVYRLVIKDYNLDWEQFDKQWKEGFSKVELILRFY